MGQPVERGPRCLWLGGGAPTGLGFKARLSGAVPSSPWPWAACQRVGAEVGAGPQAGWLYPEHFTDLGPVILYEGAWDQSRLRMRKPKQVPSSAFSLLAHR